MGNPAVAAEILLPMIRKIRNILHCCSTLAASCSSHDCRHLTASTSQILAPSTFNCDSFFHNGLPFSCQCAFSESGRCVFIFTKTASFFDIFNIWIRSWRSAAACMCPRPLIQLGSLGPKKILPQEHPWLSLMASEYLPRASYWRNCKFVQSAQVRLFVS